MSTNTVTTPTLKSAASDYWARVKSGDIGSLPAVLGLIALCGVFTGMSDVFLTAGNFANLLTQAASVIVIAMGLIFVLLLGEIDLGLEMGERGDQRAAPALVQIAQLARHLTARLAALRAQRMPPLQ